MVFISFLASICFDFYFFSYRLIWIKSFISEENSYFFPKVYSSRIYCDILSFLGKFYYFSFFYKQFYVGY